MTSAQGSEQRRPQGRWLSCDRSRPLDHRLLASVVTAFILVVVSWALAKCGLPRTADQAAPTRPEPGEGGEPAPSGAGLLA
jgi:hypothetical protein